MTAPQFNMIPIYSVVHGLVFKNSADMIAIAYWYIMQFIGKQIWKCKLIS